MTSGICFISGCYWTLSILIVSIGVTHGEIWQTRFNQTSVCGRNIKVTGNNPFLSASYSTTFNKRTGTGSWSRKKSDRYPLNIIAQFALTGEYRAGMSYLPAALLAIEHVKMDRYLLPGYELQLNAYDTQGKVPIALDAIYTEVYTRKPFPLMVMGATKSHVTEATAPVSYMWGMCQISYSAVSPYLSDKSIFPSFFRVMTPEQNLTVARIQLLKAMNWSRVHLIYQNYKLFSTMVENLRQDLALANITVISVQLFTDDPWDSVRALKALDARIIIGSFYDDMALQVMCSAFKLDPEKSWFKKVVWFLPSFLDARWMSHWEERRNCTPKDIQEVIGSYFYVGSKTFHDAEDYVPVGDNPREKFDNLYGQVNKSIPKQFRHLYAYCGNNDSCHLNCQHRAPEAYDTVWAIALALNNTLNHLRKTDNRTLRDFDFGCRHKDIPRMIREQMQSVNFSGLTGPFTFNSLGERTLAVTITRYINEAKTFRRVGECSHSDAEGWKCFVDKTSITWDTVNGDPPLDGLQTKSRVLVISIKIRLTFCCLATVGIIVALALLIFSVKERNHMLVKRSSPLFNNIILVGSIFAFVSVIVKKDTSNEDSTAFCMVPIITLVVAFSMGFGALFAKNWRIYQIFAAGAKVLNTKMLKDFNLCLFIIALLLVNICVFVAWVVISPESPTLVSVRNTSSVMLGGSEYDLVDQVRRCESTYGLHFTVVLLAIQGMTMLFGTYLAHQIRKVPHAEAKLMEANYSKRFVWCVFHVIVLSPVSVVIVMATRDQPTLNFALESTMIIVITSVTLAIIFIPKILGFRKHNRKCRQKDKFSQCQIFILSSRDIRGLSSGSHSSYGLQQSLKDTRDLNPSRSNVEDRQQSMASTSLTTKCDAWQQTDEFFLMTNASVNDRLTSELPPRQVTPKGHCELAMSFSTFDTVDHDSKTRRKSDSILRRLSLDTGFSTSGYLRPSLRNSEMTLEEPSSPDDVLVKLKTDMKMKSTVEFHRSRSERKNSHVKMAEIQELPAVFKVCDRGGIKGKTC